MVKIPSIYKPTAPNPASYTSSNRPSTSVATSSFGTFFGQYVKGKSLPKITPTPGTPVLTIPLATPGISLPPGSQAPVITVSGPSLPATVKLTANPPQQMSAPPTTSITATP